MLYVDLRNGQAASRRTFLVFSCSILFSVILLVVYYGCHLLAAVDSTNSRAIAFLSRPTVSCAIAFLLTLWLTRFYNNPLSKGLSIANRLALYVVLALPRRTVSRLVGVILSYPIPGRFLRGVLFNRFVSYYSVNTKELLAPLESYSSFAKLFARDVNLATRKNFVSNRSLSAGLGSSSENARLFDDTTDKDPLVSEGSPSKETFSFVPHPDTLADAEQADILYAPADSVLSAVGNFSQPFMEQLTVKGQRYSIYEFLFNYSDAEIAALRARDAFPTLRLQDGEKSLIHYAIFYLAPGDYHQFHASTAHTVHNYTHIPGDLFPVNDLFIDSVDRLLARNERVVVSGSYILHTASARGYDNLFFAYVPVGALNVGSISMCKTGASVHTNNGLLHSLFRRSASRSVNAMDTYNPGEKMGGFNFGSTVVLLFEVPLGYTVSLAKGVSIGCKVSVGDSILYINGPAGV